MANQSNQNWQFKIFMCYRNGANNCDDELVGILVSIIHFSCSTYFIGYTNQLGRKLNANYLMLWHSMIYAKKTNANGTIWVVLIEIHPTV